MNMNYEYKKMKIKINFRKKLNCFLEFFKLKFKWKDEETMRKFTADFETATWLSNETYVWAWAVCEIGNVENLIIDNNIDSFMSWCENAR